MEQKKGLKKLIDNFYQLQTWYMKDEDNKELQHQIVKAGQQILDNIIKTCTNKEIKNFGEFDKNYHIKDFYSEDFVYTFLDIIDDFSFKNNSFEHDKISIYSAILNTFELDIKTRQDFELSMINSKYYYVNKKEAKSDIDNFIKTYPQSPDGYDTLCEWEYSKKNPNMKKIAQIIKKAHSNNSYVCDDEYYIDVIDYYYSTHEDSEANFYSNLHHDMQMKLEKDFNEFIDDEDFSFFDDFPTGNSDLKNIADDNIENGKKIEQYILEKHEEELTFFLGPQMAFTTFDQMTEISNKGIKNYVLNNYMDLVKSDLKYLPSEQIQILKNFPDDGILKLSEDTLLPYGEVHNYLFLKQYGIAFIGTKNNIISIAIPAIKQIKKYLQNNKIIATNKDINEKMNVIVGMTELFGALDNYYSYNIFKTIYPSTPEETFMRLICLCNLFAKIQMDVDFETSDITMIYNYFLNKDEALSILKKSSKVIPLYSKDTFLQYSSFDKIIENNENFKKLVEIFNPTIKLSAQFYDILIDILMQNSIDARLGKNMTNPILKNIKNELKELNIDVKNIDFKDIKQLIENLFNEIPKWK